mgnify:FL=1
MRKVILASQGAIAIALLLTSISNHAANYSVTHHFSINDLQGDFTTGETYAQNPNLLCGIVNSPACPKNGVQPLLVDGVNLYPIDSEFGFYVVDYVGGFTKQLDGAYTEGFIGNFSDGMGTGVMTSNAPTLRFKTPKPAGTWCAGMGGTSVKCSTENYAVLEHILTCYESIPYFYKLIKTQW